MFSRRVAHDLRPNRITTARATWPPRWDLTVSNPTACGIPYPADLLGELADPRGLAYRPHAFGLPEAREAVAAEYRRWRATVDPAAVALTASTSEAYSFIFKLLCEPGEAVLVPVPSYPLFEHLARVEGVEPVGYRLDPDAGWCLDLAELEEAPTRVRAVVVVHPNNPTGSFLHPRDAAALAALAGARGWALVVDEVFLDYTLDGGAGSGRSLASATECLTFCLGGLSKSCALPQLKLSWIVTSGPADLARDAMERLEVIADTFLSVATPVQLALPGLLRVGGAVREAIGARCRCNLDALRAKARRVPALEVIQVGGGWSAVLRVPAVMDEEELVVELLREHGVAVYPGFFFDFPWEGVLVLSLLPEPGVFLEGCRRVVDTIASRL